MLLLERDELKYVECKNIEMAYMLTLGALEYKAFELHCMSLRLKRKIDLIQTKINRQEKVLIFEIERALDDEFAEYRKRLDEQIEKMNAALERNKGEFLSDEEAKELKALYRIVVKALHPDLHPNTSEAQLKLFYNAVAAYENGDLNTLRIIKEMIGDSALLEADENGLSALLKEKERLISMLEEIKAQIADIKNSYPYTLKHILQNESLIAEKKANLEDIILKLNKSIEAYKRRIEEALR